jgi:4-amino-4-deoxy-L-arabinose transferase-like glycosyltransferase
MKNKEILYWSIFFLILILIPISNYSIWVDESMTAFIASQPTIFEFYYKMLGTNLSESQMPGYMLYIWTWIKVFGFSEISLRLSNVPFLFFFILVLLSSPLDKWTKLIIAGISCFSPIIWFYLNEARYVILIFSASGICITSIIYYFNGNLQQKKFGIILFTLSTMFGISLNMLFLFFLLPITVFALLFAFRTDANLKQCIQEWLISIAIIAISCISWMFYYIWTVQKGAGGMLETPGIGNIAYTLYEFFGFIGIGPPRDVLREHQSFQVILSYLPLIIPLLLSYLALVGLIVYQFKKNLKILLFNPFFISFVIGFVSFLLVAYAFQFRFWGRHLIFIYPFLIFYISEVIIQSINNHSIKKAYFIIASAFLVLFGISNFNIRFSEAYQKENNKLAVETAVNFADTDKDIIWISYGGLCAEYYGLRSNISNDNVPLDWPHIRTVELIIARDPQLVKEKLEAYRMKGAIIVFFNKSLDYDKNEVFKNFIKNHETTLLMKNSGFMIYDLKACL